MKVNKFKKKVLQSFLINLKVSSKNLSLLFLLYYIISLFDLQMLQKKKLQLTFFIHSTFSLIMI